MRKGDNLPLSCAVVMKSRNLNMLEPFGPLQACNRTALYISYGSPFGVAGTFQTYPTLTYRWLNYWKLCVCVCVCVMHVFVSLTVCVGVCVWGGGVCIDD